VIEQCFRVLKPGGTFVICDSIQVADAPDMVPAMEGFVETFHEPYYRHYTQDNLVQRLEQAGFTDVSVQVHFMSKYLVARKPIAPTPKAALSTDGAKQLSYDRQ
jgi:SAM-dependent methyltransferase